MRSCIAYGAFLVERGEKDGEVYLMEARQLCKKLEIDFYAVKINVLLARHATNAKTFEEARRYLYEAEDLFSGLQECDQKQLRPLLKATTDGLDKAILQSSITAARELKTICKVYEEARFPIEEMKPDLAYQVTQSVGAESLFMVRRFKRGYDVPLAYNIPVKEAKEMVRRLDRERTLPLMSIRNDPKIFELSGGATMVGVPTQSDEEYVLCTMFREHRSFSPRQLEFLLASAEAMERLAGDREMKPPVMGDDGFIEKEDTAPAHPRGSFKDILTIDPEMIKLIHLAERASRSEAPILLEGETGVGKELFARAIHENSPRRDKPFVAINAGGMPINFLESQLFGHIKGAYTDAANDRIGLVEEARGGTIFFDEIGEMGEELQVKLLRLLENGEFRRLGDNRVHHAEVRVISATNRDLMKEVERREFRRDLFYRLGTVKLTVPPLRFRQRDIQLLIRHFLKESAARNRMFDRHFQIDVKAMEALEIYNWPGNVRELHNEMMRIVSLIGDVDMIRFGMLSDAIREYVKLKNRSEGLLEESVERYERRLILDALNRNDWNRLRTAEDVGIPRTTLLAKMKRLNIATR
jgi:DNA-binding NtrC family response regulator